LAAVFLCRFISLYWRLYFLKEIKFWMLSR